ncbi:universal stress protein [Kitasatospora sp. NPDC089509]|uniref:universal stress protein n=1 Tax=Kitasatospora sp. NPDC089509 TaxID=3364079 RepID=UPI00381CF375
MSMIVERVVVGVDGSEGSLTALELAAEEAARHHAQLCPVLAWDVPGGEAMPSSQPVPFPTFEDTVRQCEQRAERRMAKACEAVLASLPADVEVRPSVLRAQPGPALVALARHDTDMLVVGVGHRSLGERLRRRSTRRYCLKHAECPVLVVTDEPSTGRDGEPARGSADRDLPTTGRR